MTSRSWALALILIVHAAIACGGESSGGGDLPTDADAAVAAGDPDAGPDLPAADAAVEPPATQFDIVVDVGPAGPYGQHSFDVPARSNWVNTGLFLRAGETATIAASGTWSYHDEATGPDGIADIDVVGCPAGMLVARSGLHYEDARACVGAGAEYTAPRDGILYVGANVSTDLGETYESRVLESDGTIEVTVEGTGDTAPSIAIGELAGYDLAAVASGWVELRGAHSVVTVPVADAVRDLGSAAASIRVLDSIYELHQEIRGAVPAAGQRIRFFPDPDVVPVGYMLAGNPIRCDPSIMSGGDTQRILRASEQGTDIWGFAHEVGHDFTMAGGTWVYMYPNLESWPNIFTVHALRALDRTEDQPNLATYCDGRDAYLAAPSYPTLRSDPFLQLCFLLEFEEDGGASFWPSFFAALNDLTNEDVQLDTSDPEDRMLWGWIRDRFSEAAGVDVTPRFQAWSVPLP